MFFWPVTSAGSVRHSDREQAGMRSLTCDLARVTERLERTAQGIVADRVSSSLGIRQFPNWDSLMFHPQIMRRASGTYLSRQDVCLVLGRTHTNSDAHGSNAKSRHRSTPPGSDCLSTIRKAVVATPSSSPGMVFARLCGRSVMRCH